jgi:D-Ala-D-Ala ligase-like protein
MSSSAKIRLALLFGGRSGEHDVSIMSARSVMAALDPDKYDVRPVRIGGDGRWQLEQGVNALQEASRPAASGQTAALAHGPSSARDLATAGYSPILDGDRREIDVVFPVIHGTYGEDGALQGFPNWSTARRRRPIAVKPIISSRLRKRARGGFGGAGAPRGSVIDLWTEPVRGSGEAVSAARMGELAFEEASAGARGSNNDRAGGGRLVPWRSTAWARSRLPIGGARE